MQKNVFVILAAGLSSRMRPLTDHMHKCLLDIGGNKIIESTIDDILEFDNNAKIVVVTGHKHQGVINFLEDTYEADTDITVLRNAYYSTTNTSKSLMHAIEHLLANGITRRRLFVIEGDMHFIDSPFKYMAPNSYMTLSRTTELQPEWTVDLEPNSNRISCINVNDDSDKPFIVGCSSWSDLDFETLAVRLDKLDNQAYWDSLIIESGVLDTLDVRALNWTHKAKEYDTVLDYQQHLNSLALEACAE